MANSQKNNGSFYTRANNFLEKYEFYFLALIVIVTSIYGYLLFDPRVSLTGDDAEYILRANNFFNDFSYPGYQGPLYPVALSLLIPFFGFSLKALKIFSFVCYIGFTVISFFSFRKYIPYIVLFSSLALISVNWHFLFFASQTYSEAFYMFVQALVVMYFLKQFIYKHSQDAAFAVLIKRHLLLALLVLTLALSRTIGYSFVMAVFAYFILCRQWKNTGLFAASFAAVFLLFRLSVYLLWPETALSEQSSQLFAKDFYNPAQGNETIIGLLERTLQNIDIYFSAHLLNIFGLNTQAPLLYKITAMAILVTILLLGLVWFSFKKNKYLFFIGLVAACFYLTTFVSLHVFWSQERLLIPCMLFVIILLFGGYYYLTENRKALQPFILIPFFILLLTGMSDSNKQIKVTSKLKNEYSGLAPDWRNYTMASSWVGKELRDAVVVCRKPAISAIYAGGKHFEGISYIPSENVQDFIRQWESQPHKYKVYNTDSTDYDPKLKKGYLGRLIIGADNQFFLIDNEIQGKDSLFTGETSLAHVKNLFENSSGQRLFLCLADSLLSDLKNRKITHVLTANLRINPDRKDGNIINTVERFMYYIQEKYPDYLELTCVFGEANDEPARIFEIKWDYVEQSQLH